MAKDKILLILDLDETLIHATEKELSRPPDFTVFGYAVYKRPYLDRFLTDCSQHFKLAIWSSADDDYVAEIVKRIVPEDVSLQFVWGRSRCTYCFDTAAFEAAYYGDYLSHYHYIKVLKKVKKKGYLLQQVLIVDDTPSKGRKNYGNVICPTAYLGEPDDNELLLLLQYLTQLKDIENVRAIEKRTWRNQISTELKVE